MTNQDSVQASLRHAAESSTESDGLVHLMASYIQVLPLGLPLKADRPERTSAPFTLVNELPSLPSSTARARRDVLPILAPVQSLRTRHVCRRRLLRRRREGRQWAGVHRPVSGIRASGQPWPRQRELLWSATTMLENYHSWVRASSTSRRRLGLHRRTTFLVPNIDAGQDASRFPPCSPRIPSPKVPSPPLFLLALLARKLFHHDIEAIHQIV